MKLFLDYELNNSGKGKFLRRLIPALKKIGVETYFREKGCDVALGISRWRTKTKLPKVIRVDGIHLKENDKNNWKNERIRKGIKKSEAVIYQSEYARKQCEDFFQLKKKHTYVIFNGANPEDYDITMPGYTEYSVISSAKWCHRNGYRKHKRLQTVIDVAKACKRKDVHFFIAGKLLDKYNDTENLTFLGQLKDEILRRYLAEMDAMLYPAAYDWCPNAVVEALCAEVPVICTEGHGTTELIRACGGRVVNNKIDIPEILWAIDDLIKNPVAVDTTMVDIKRTAWKYKRVFEKVLK